MKNFDKFKSTMSAQRQAVVDALQNGTPEDQAKAFERQIIEHLPDEVEWMTRSSDGSLSVHCAEPERRFYGEWISSGDYDFPINNVFKHVQYMDDDPWNFREEAE